MIEYFFAHTLSRKARALGASGRMAPSPTIATARSLRSLIDAAPLLRRERPDEVRRDLVHVLDEAGLGGDARRRG